MASSTLFSTSHPTFHSSLFPLSNLRNHQRSLRIGRRRNGVFCSISEVPRTGICLGRRDLGVFGVVGSVSLLFPSHALFASSDMEGESKMVPSSDMEGESKMESVVDDINAYSFSYPIDLPSKNVTFKWVVSRKPERYSSAAPLSPDARQRIVSERVDMINNLVVSVSIGPPNKTFLASSDKSAWTARNVADAVLSDKSALRVTSSQRLAESSILDAHTTNIDGVPYWYYEYLVRKSPTKSVQESNIYRHYMASTAERDGYLYTFNVSTLSKQWPTMGPILEKSVASFRLIPPTENYVPPFKDPWRFW